jgi:hypothetical protein
MQMIGSFAEFERATLRLRTSAGTFTSGGKGKRGSPMFVMAPPIPSGQARVWFYRPWEPSAQLFANGTVLVPWMAAARS